MMSMREQMNVTASATPFSRKKQFLCMFNCMETGRERLHTTWSIDDPEHGTEPSRR